MSNDVYYYPEKHGLQTVGSVSWSDEAYQFDLTVVWRDVENGALYWADDSGCSCPSPFEDYTSRDELKTGEFWDLTIHLGNRLQGVLDDEYTKHDASRAQNEIIDLLWKVRLL